MHVLMHVLKACRPQRTGTAVLLAAGLCVTLLAAGSGGAQEQPADAVDEALCASADDENVAAACDEAELDLGVSSFGSAEKEDGLPAVCRYTVEVVFWTGENWQRLGEALAANPNPCAQYYISIPPTVADRTRLRIRSAFDELRDLGPQFHPMPEMTLHLATGWVNWIKNNKKTWYEAGVEFRRRMAERGIDASLEPAFVNEMDGETRTDTGDKTRANVLELLRGLHDGPPGSPPAQSMIEIGIAGRHQDLSDVSTTYKEELKTWLADGSFWNAADPYIRTLAVEAYPDTLKHGVPGSSRDERRRHLEDYLFHVLDLAEAGPESAEPARVLFHRAYLPLTSAGWAYSRGFGNTIVSAGQMAHFISEQVYAVRHYAGAHPQGAPNGRIGLAWDPQRLNPDGTPIMTIPVFNSGIALLRERIAESLRWAYRNGGASPAGACSRPDSGENWCQMQREGAQFEEYWAQFGSWD